MMITQSQFERFANHPAEFRAHLNIDCDGTVKQLGDVMEEFQRKDFRALDQAMKNCCGRGGRIRVKTPMRAYIERSRGHSKTSDLAVICVWILAFANRAVKGYAYAADKDQAALLKDAIDVLLRLNPWLGKIIQVQKGIIVNIAKGHPGYGARLEISTSDVSSSWGILPDFVIADELCHWQGDGSLWHSILSSAAKRKNCLLVVISNAGFVETWQWQVREAARIQDPYHFSRPEAGWYFSRLDGPQATWITEDRLAEQRKMLPAMAYNRLWLNEWSNAGGDALTPEDIEAAFIEGLQPMTGNEKDYYFVGGSDLGISRDHSAFVVLAVPKGGKSGKIRLAHNKLWKPVAGQKINLLEVERHILECDKKFHLECVAYDTFQHEMLAQQIEADTNRKRRNVKRRYHLQPFMREVPPTPTNLRQQASLTIESFQDHRFRFYPCEPLKRDLHRLRVEEKSYGFRLVSPRDGEGHGDTASAFCLALLLAHEMAGKKKVVLSSHADNSHMNAIDRRMEAERKEQEYWAERERQDPTGILAAMESGKLNTFTHGF